MSEDEKSLRLANLVTPYGVGTRSYNRSPEKREMDRQRAEATAEHKAETILLPLTCTCLQSPHPHDLSLHRKIRDEAYNPRRKREWPWSLCLSERVEESTERG